MPLVATPSSGCPPFDCHAPNTILRGTMATNNNNRLPVRAPPDDHNKPAPPRQPGSALLSIAQALIDKSKKAGQTAASAGGRAARAAGRAAHSARRVAPEKAADMAIEEGASLGSHLAAHATHRYLGGVGVGVKGGLELLALVVAKVKKASPKMMRGLRSTLRGTLHHSLGTGLHRRWPIPPTAARRAVTTTSGVEAEADIGEAEIAEEDVAGNTHF